MLPGSIRGRVGDSQERRRSRFGGCWLHREGDDHASSRHESPSAQRLQLGDAPDAVRTIQCSALASLGDHLDSSQLVANFFERDFRARHAELIDVDW